MSLIRMIQRLPYEVKVAMLAIAALGAIMLNPFTAIILAIGAILLLLDDFYTWQRGGESMFGDMWQQLADFQKKLANTTFESQALNDLKDAVYGVADSFRYLEGKWGELNKNVGTVDGISILQAILAGIDAATFGIRETIKSTVSIFEWMLDKAGELFDKGKELWDNAFGKKDNQQPASKNGEEGSFNLKLPKISLPVMANPAISKAMSTLKQYTDVKQDNSMNTEINVAVTGADAESAAIATAKEIEAIFRRNATSWQNARIRTIPKG